MIKFFSLEHNLGFRPESCAMDKKLVIRKTKQLMKAKGVALWKLGEALGSRGGQQAKIDRANRLLRGEQRSISFDEVNKLARFFDKPESFFLTKSASLAEQRASYRKLTPAVIDKMLMRDIDEILGEIAVKHPEILDEAVIEDMGNSMKRVVLKAFYKK